MANFENIGRNITARIMGPWPPFCLYTSLTLETKCGISFIEVGPQTYKLLSKILFFFWKPTKGHNSKSYRPLAPIPVNTVHPVIVHVYTNFQLSSFHSSWEICYKSFQKMQNLKTYEGQELWALGHHSAITPSLPQRASVILVSLK